MEKYWIIKLELVEITDIIGKSPEGQWKNPKILKFIEVHHWLKCISQCKIVMYKKIRLKICAMNDKPMMMKYVLN